MTQISLFGCDLGFIAAEIGLADVMFWWCDGIDYEEEDELISDQGMQICCILVIEKIWSRNLPTDNLEMYSISLNKRACVFSKYLLDFFDRGLVA